METGEDCGDQFRQQGVMFESSSRQICIDAINATLADLVVAGKLLRTHYESGSKEE